MFIVSAINSAFRLNISLDHKTAGNLYFSFFSKPIKTLRMLLLDESVVSSKKI